MEVEVVGVKKKNWFVYQVDLIQRAKQQFLKPYETTLLFVTYEKTYIYIYIDRYIYIYIYIYIILLYIYICIYIYIYI